MVYAMNKKYLSIHFEHNNNETQGIMNRGLTSFATGEFSQEESFDYDSKFKVYDISSRRKKKHALNGFSAQLSLEEEADLTEYDNFVAYEYLTEPELHIFKIRNPFFDDEIDQVVYVTTEGELITKLSASLQEQENLEDSFLDGQIHDYSYGAETDCLLEPESNTLDDDFFLEDNPEKMSYETLLAHGILHITVTGKILTLENNLANDSWNVYIDKKKLAEIFLSAIAEECVVNDNIVTFYDSKGRVQKASVVVTFSDKKTIEFDDLDSIRVLLA